jgi:antitoxin component YwqK of YwqJK toxin-antitoxin module
MYFNITFFIISIFSSTLFYSQNIPLKKVTNIERDTIYSKVDVGLVTGVVTDFFENGNIKIYAEYKDGLRNGEFKKWHSNGQIIYSGKFINGKKNGIFIKNDIFGKKLSKVKYKQNIIIWEKDFTERYP